MKRKKRPGKRISAFLGVASTQLARPPVLVSGGFVVIGAAISVNALLLQPGRHPAPLFAHWAADGSVHRRADPVVGEIQAALQASGLYAGPVDGFAGPQTEAAIRAFERGAGRVETGRANAELLDAIRSTKRPAADNAATVEAEPPPDEKVALVQKALARAAYGPLRTDGVFGPQTRDAIIRFQTEHGLSPTGEMSDALIVELRAAGALDGD